MTEILVGNSNSNNIYTFLDYEVFSHQREVLQGGNKLALSKKSFDTLLFLLKRQGDVISKQELLDVIWPNQIVTDAALNKQITRLRRDLVSQQISDEIIIETIRGVGVRFVPEVQVKEPASQKTTTNLSRLKILIWIVPLLVWVILYFSTDIFTKKQDTEQGLKQKGKQVVEVIETPQMKSINVAIVPSKKNIDWLNVGGLDYLSGQLQKHKEIHIINPRDEWFKKGDSQFVSIELSHKQGIDYVLTVKNLLKDKDYQADLVLRNQSGILAKKIITATNLNLLFDRIDSWVTHQLKISSIVNQGDILGYATTEFALESFLKGLDIAKHQNYSKAVQLIQAAVNDDPDFFIAWLFLANIESEMGNNNKALALVNVLEQRTDFDQRLLDNLYQVKSSILVGLNQIEEAKVTLNKAIKLSKEQNDMLTLIEALGTKAGIEFKIAPINEKISLILQEQLDLIKQYDPDPLGIAYTTINLAQVYHNTKQHNLAVEYAQRAYELFNKENSVQGIFSSATIIAEMHFDMAETSKSLQVLERIQSLYKNIDSYDAKGHFLQVKIDTLANNGFRTQANTAIENLKELSTTHVSYDNKIVAIIKNIDTDILYKDYNSAKNNIVLLTDIINNAEIKILPVYQYVIKIYELYVAAYTEPPKQARLMFNNYQQQYPKLQEFFAKEMRYVKNIFVSKDGFRSEAIKEYDELIEIFREDNQIYNALDIGYLLLDLLWQNDMEDYQKTMNYLDEISTFKYPIDKYKAQFLAFNKDYINAYIMMVDLKSKANEFWTIKDQILLEEYQQLAQDQ